MCTLCPLSKSRIHAVPGEGSASAKVVFVGEGPGREEDRQGRPFVGAAGQVLNEALSSAGFRRREVYITNIVKCRPPGNRVPTKEEREACLPYLVRQLKAIQPRIVCLLGKTAMETIVGRGSLSHKRGKTIDRDGMKVLLTYHPAATIYNPQLKESIFSDIKRIWTELERLKTSKEEPKLRKYAEALPVTFYSRDSLKVARDLLGKIIVTDKKVRKQCRIVETEAYLRGDPAAHSFDGMTKRNKSMFMGPGTLYVFTMHRQNCMNAVTNSGEAVLIRAGEALVNVDNPVDGPGKLCSALDITREDDGKSLVTSDVRIVSDGFVAERILTTRRIGITKAKDRPYRFVFTKDHNERKRGC